MGAELKTFELWDNRLEEGRSTWIREKIKTVKSTSANTALVEDGYRVVYRGKAVLGTRGSIIDAEVTRYIEAEEVAG